MGHITVVVPVKDRRERMLRCLDAIAAQDHPSFEVVAIDNGSTDGTLDALRERAARGDVELRVARAEGLIGRVRNEGARLARGEIVAFTDSDCRPAPGWLRAATAPFADRVSGWSPAPPCPPTLPPWPLVRHDRHPRADVAL